MRILFMGSPEIAVPFLETLHKQEEVVGVVTLKDQPAGRGYKLKPPPVKEAALHLGLGVHQPEQIKNNRDFLELLKNLGIDLSVVIAYGKILPREILEAPRIGSINIHFSLLPKYRGPAPIQWVLINGEKQTGITIFWMNEKIDAGEIILQEKVDISPEDNYLTLSGKLVTAGISVLNKSLKLIKDGKSPKIPQSTLETSYAPLLHKPDGEIKWDKSSRQIHNLVRGLVSWPGTYTKYKTENGHYKILKILESKIYTPDIPEIKQQGSPGQIVEIIKNEGIVAKCGQGYLLITQVKLEGGKEMPIYDFLLGHKIKIGEILGGM